MVRFIFILLFTIVSFNTFSQSKWSYGYVLSPDAVFRNKKEIPAGTHSNTPVRFTTGINIARNFNKKTGIVTGIWISQRAYSYSRPTVKDPIDPILTHYVFTETYLEVPLLLKYSTPIAKKWSFYKTSGIVFSTPLYGGSALPKQYGFSFSRSELTNHNNYRQLYILATISAGLAYQCSQRTQLTIEPNIKYSLNTQYTNDAQHMREYSVGIRFGVYRNF